MTHHLRAIVIATTVVAVAAVACGDDAQTPLTEQTADVGNEPPDDGNQPPASGPAAVLRAESELGDILVDADGMTLYGFTNDTDGTSECSGTCADQWPPLTVDTDWSVGPELDPAIFNGHSRQDGGEQLVAGPWPLYRYAGDAVPGDLEGQGSGGVWYAVSADDGTLIRDAADGDGYGYGDDASGEAAGPADVQVGSTELGDVLTDADGHTLYGFTDDVDALPTCVGECAGTWPPLLVDGEVAFAEGLDPEVFTTVDGAEGGTQLVAGIWPLYTFAGDSAPGDVSGQGLGDVWFAVAPDGSLIR